jgi:L-fuculose-phosphate aldolase
MDHTAWDRARREVLLYAQRMFMERLVNWTAGNVSCRIDSADDLIAVTPSAVPYDTMSVDDILIVTTGGEVVDGTLRPTSELPMHTLAYQRRADVGAVVHTHGSATMAMASLGWQLPAFMPAIVGWGGGAIPVTPYARSGTSEMADAPLRALEDRSACFLHSHGLLAIGASLKFAYGAASVVESAADTYLRARAYGEVMELDPKEIERLRRTWKKRWERPT